ncbi:MAG TPA: BamA/TamA family outer membrane protein [Gemmatimonas sp.]|nr:BamA/TamA family outer membrane protein [Gemmatimonas sp.]
MNFTLAALAGLAALCFLPATPASAQNRRDDIAELERPEVRDLQIRGARVISANELKESLATRESSCKSLVVKPFCLFTKSHYVYARRYLDREEFSRDVIRLLVIYFQRGYREARVDTVVTRVGSNGVKIAFNVTEGPPTRVVSSVVQDAGGVLSAKDIAREFRPKVGQPLNLLALDSAVARFRLLLLERGYADAVLSREPMVNDSLRTANVRVLIDAKRRVTIGDIRVEGSEKVAESTIRNSLSIESGDLFKLSEISRSQRSLYESGLFRRAIIDSAGSRDTVKSLVIRVQEGPLREARVSAGFTTADFIQAEGHFTHNYWLGGARRLDLSLTIGNLLAQQLTRSSIFTDISNITATADQGRYFAPTYQASADVRQRWFQSPRNTIGAGIFTSRRSSPGVFIDRGYGANTTFTRELALRAPLSAVYRFEITSVEAGDVYFCINYGVCDRSTITALRGEQRLSPVALTFSLNTSDAPFSPRSGILGRAELEHASAYTASNFRYNRALIDVALYRPLPFRRAVGAAHIRAGWVDPLASTGAAVGVAGVAGGSGVDQVLHPRKRFYAGGSQSVRGFGENQLGPRVLTIDPDSLRGKSGVGDAAKYRCPLSTPLTSCSVADPAISDGAFQPRPLGGTTLLEGGIEFRVPVWRALVGAVFIDAAILGEGDLRSITKGTGAITPGFGVRYESPVGPIRVDLGIRPLLRENLRVITQVADSTGALRLVDLSPAAGCTADGTVGCRVFPSTTQKKGFIDRLTNRLTLHLSIGQAF